MSGVFDTTVIVHPSHDGMCSMESKYLEIRRNLLESDTRFIEIDAGSVINTLLFYMRILMEAKEKYSVSDYKLEDKLNSFELGTTDDDIDSNRNTIFSLDTLLVKNKIVVLMKNCESLHYLDAGNKHLNKKDREAILTYFIERPSVKIMLFNSSYVANKTLALTTKTVKVTKVEEIKIDNMEIATILTQLNYDYETSMLLYSQYVYGRYNSLATFLGFFVRLLKKSYIQQMSMLSVLDRKILLEVARVNGKNIFSKESLERIGATKSTVNTTLNKLQDQAIVYKYNKTILFHDGLLFQHLTYKRG